MKHAVDYQVEITASFEGEEDEQEAVHEEAAGHTRKRR